MITIDVTERAIPTNWTQVAQALGVSQETLKKCRKDLGRLDDRLTPELYEELGWITSFCRLRAEGGGAKYTRAEFVRLKNQGKDVLEAKLRADRII